MRKWRHTDSNSDTADTELYSVLSDKEVVVLLKNAIGNSTITGYANSIGCTAQYLSDVCRGQRKPGKKILSTLGLRKETVYRRWR